MSDHNSLANRMKRARKYYGASKALMSEVCGFGANTWAAYENGDEPIQSNLLLIELALTPAGFIKLVEMMSPDSPRSVKAAEAHERAEKMNAVIEHEVENYRRDLQKSTTII